MMAFEAQVRTKMGPFPRLAQTVYIVAPDLKSAVEKGEGATLCGVPSREVISITYKGPAEVVKS